MVANGTEDTLLILLVFQSHTTLQCHQDKIITEDV